METVRLNKYLAECGICSRRDADKLILAGKVSVNGKPAGMGEKISEKDAVSVKGKAVRGRLNKVVLAYYKPIGVTCTEKDKYADRTIIQAVDYPVRVTYAGRLDKDSEGLILLSNDGDLIQHMMKASGYHEKEYVVKVRKELTAEFLEKMAGGVYLKELGITTRKCEISRDGKYTLHIVLTQGVNRQIRRMCKELGNDVVSLKRVRIMHILLGRLKPGEYREITGEELDLLYRGVYKKG